MRQYVFAVGCIVCLVLASRLMPGINRQREEFQLTEIIIAPSIQTEGKLAQRTQRVGMGK